MTAPKPRVVGLNAPELGRLADGTPYFAPLGELPYDPDEDKVQCHLCGDWFRLVGAGHLRWHGWTLGEYREAFHLLRKTSTAAAGVSDKLRRNAITRKRTNERWANPPPAATPSPTGRGVPRWRSLAALRPQLASELHPTRNGDLDPYALGLGSRRRLWWRCGTCGYEWRASIHHRVATDAGCRRCTSPAWRVPHERSLAVLRPDLASELHPTRNGELDPYQLGAGSHLRLWWRCRSCGHEWRTAVKGRSGAGYGCPRCARERRATAQRVPRERSLAELRPDLAKELHPTRNDDLDPHQVAPTSRRSVWWRCGTCGHEWRTLLSTRARGHGCPECRRRAQIGQRRRVPRERSLVALRPDLASELHPTRNGDLDATTLARWSVQPVWWRCATCRHEWQATPQNRQGCPRCSRRRPAPRERSLAVLRPHLAGELHPTRNGALDPYRLAPGSHQKVWWRCPYCARDWQARVASRSHSPGGCPSCAKRRGALKRSRDRAGEPTMRVPD